MDGKGCDLWWRPWLAERQHPWRAERRQRRWRSELGERGDRLQLPNELLRWLRELHPGRDYHLPDLPTEMHWRLYRRGQTKLRGERLRRRRPAEPCAWRRRPPRRCSKR